MPSASEPGAGLTIEPVTPARWDDMVDLFARAGPRGGRTYSSGCWCVLWRVPSKEFNAGWGKTKGEDRGAANQSVMAAIVAEGRVPGLLAYDDGVPVGWCAVGPRHDLPRLRTSRQLHLEGDDEGVWSVSCFYVHGTAKRRGVARALLDAAIGYAQRCGATVIEGYPVEPGHSDPFTGHRALFEAAGFHIEPREGSRAVARLDLPGR